MYVVESKYPIYYCKDAEFAHDSPFVDIAQIFSLQKNEQGVIHDFNKYKKCIFNYP